MESNTVQISTSGFPANIPHIKLATYNKTTTTLVDQRPHDLGVANMRPVLCSEASEYVESGELTITSGNTTGAITFPITFDGQPDLTLGVRMAADATLRYANYYSLTDTGATLKISSAAPASGVRVSWMAKGPYTPSLTGSG